MTTIQICSDALQQVPRVDPLIGLWHQTVLDELVELAAVELDTFFFAFGIPDPGIMRLAVPYFERSWTFEFDET